MKLKKGTKTKAAEPVEKEVAPAVTPEELDRIVQAKLDALLGTTTTPTPTAPVVPTPKIETPKMPSIPKIPVPGAAPKIDFDAKQLKLPEDQVEGFEKMVGEYNERKAMENQLKGQNEEDRMKILATMGDKEKYVGNIVDVNVAPIKNESVDASIVVEALLANGEQGVTQLKDLARLGVIEVKKVDFEKYMKSAGGDATPFIKKGTPSKRLTVRAKVKK